MSTTALEAVRTTRGLTQGAVASSAGVSQAMISLLESGHTNASSTVLDALAGALQVPSGVLQLPAPPVQLLHAMQKSVTAAVVNRVTAEFTLAFLRTELLAPGIRHRIRSSGFQHESGSARAERLRRSWKMAPGPVQDVVRLLESQGIVCLLKDLSGTRANALVARSGRWRALMFIDPRPDEADALWAIAHELGHLISHEDADMTHEYQADDFAGEFLAPRSAVKQLLDGGTGAEELPDQFSMTPPSFAVHARRNRLITIAD